MFAQTATLKIGNVVNTHTGTILVPITLEAINPIIGWNGISGWAFYIAYDASVLNPGTPILVNSHPQFPSSNYMTNI